MLRVVSGLEPRRVHFKDLVDEVLVGKQPIVDTFCLQLRCHVFLAEGGSQAAGREL
jgi:hypothetical protein